VRLRVPANQQDGLRQTAQSKVLSTSTVRATVPFDSRENARYGIVYLSLAASEKSERPDRAVDRCRPFLWTAKFGSRSSCQWQSERLFSG
jgi:hypothetical protein